MWLYFYFVNVDDLLLSGRNLDLLSHVKSLLGAKYQMQDLGLIKHYLGMEFHFRSTGLLLHQHQYVITLKFCRKLA